MEISVWKRCGADLTRWARALVSSDVTIFWPSFPPRSGDPSPWTDRHPIARERLCEPLCVSVIVSTPMAAVCGPAPAIAAIGQLLDDRTRVQRSRFPPSRG